MFGNGAYLYSSKYLNEKEIEKGVHLQAYFGRVASHGTLSVTEMRKTPNDPKVLQLPIEPYVTNKKEVETYKQLTTVSVVRLNTHYTCLTKAFAVFVSDKEINCSKSNVLKYF